MRSFLAAFLLFSIVSVQGFSASKSDEGKVWVELETNKDANRLSAFRGLMSEKDFEDFTEGKLKKKWIKLEQVYWNAEEKFDADSGMYFLKQTILGEGGGRFRSFSGDVYIRADTIVILFSMNSGTDRKTTISRKVQDSSEE